MGYEYVVTNSLTYHLHNPAESDDKALCGFSYEPHHTASVVSQQPQGKFVLCNKCRSARG